MTQPANTQAYPGLQAIADPLHKKALRLLWDRVHSLEGRPSDTGVNFRANPNMGGTAEAPLAGLKITNAADPVDPGDYVTKRYADVTYAGPGLTAQLTPGSDALVNISTLLNNGGGGILAGPHVARPGVGTATSQGAVLYLESDRAAIYQVVNSAWLLVATYVFEGQPADRPSDLGPNDAGFLFLDTTTGITYQWSGAVWHFHQGIMFDVFANRPTAFIACDAGVIYVATDLGYHAWELDFATGAWVILRGWGGPAEGTLAGIGAVGALLGAHDVGFRYWSNDFNRVYAWQGGAWLDAYGSPPRKQLAFFDAAPDTAGWQLCDGSGITISTPSGGTAGYTVPDLITAGRFLRGAGGAGGTGGAASQTVTSGNESADTNYAVVAGGVPVPSAPHTHQVTTPTLPPYYAALPYMRL